MDAGMPTPLQEVICQNTTCNKTFEVIMPMPELINGKYTSMLLLTHLQPEQCPFCGIGYEFKLLGIDGYKFKFVPMPSANGEMKGVMPSSIIKPS